MKEKFNPRPYVCKPMTEEDWTGIIKVGIIIKEIDLSYDRKLKIHKISRNLKFLRAETKRLNASPRREPYVHYYFNWKELKPSDENLYR